MTHSIDINVGERLRAIRRWRGHTQSELAARVGLTFQQIQKYEHAINRISASRLALLAGALGVSVNAFFEDMVPLAQGGITADETNLLMESFNRMPDDLKESFLVLMNSVASAAAPARSG